MVVSREVTPLTVRSFNFKSRISTSNLDHIKEAFSILIEFDLITLRLGDRSYVSHHYFYTLIDTFQAILRFSLYYFFIEVLNS